MFSTARNILSATEDEKNKFISTFASQITENDKRIADIIAQDNNRFGAALISYIRLALCHIHDNSAEIYQAMDVLLNNTNQQNTFNISSFPKISFPPSTPILETDINIPQMEYPTPKQQLSPKIDSPNKNRIPPTPPDSPTINSPKKKNKTNATPDATPTNKDAPKSPTISRSRAYINKIPDHMDIDAIDMTHHVNQLKVSTPEDLTSNPWMDIDVTPNQPDIHLGNVTPIQPKIQPSVIYKTEKNSQRGHNNTTNVISLNANKDKIPIRSPRPLQSVDDSIHTPTSNKNKRKQTYDARVLVSEIPGSLPSEKSSYLKGWFLGVEALKNIYIDEIFHMEYFILQFDNLYTMRKLVKNFNEHTDIGAKMTPIVYIKPKADSSHQNPHHYCQQSFKVIDLDGSEEQRTMVVDAVTAITNHNAVQVLHEQPSPNELHLWINIKKYADIIAKKQSIIVGDSVVRIGPVKLSRNQFKMRNKFVGRSIKAAAFTDAHLLNNLEANGVVDVYRRTDDNITSVYLVFDSEHSYKISVTKSVWLRDVNLGIVPHTQMATRPKRS